MMHDDINLAASTLEAMVSTLLVCSSCQLSADTTSPYVMHCECIQVNTVNANK